MAFSALRGDRFLGAMGGTGTIYYQAISRFAEDHGIRNKEYAIFHRLITEMDDEYVAYCAEREEAARVERENERK